MAIPITDRVPEIRLNHSHSILLVRRRLLLASATKEQVIISSRGFGIPRHLWDLNRRLNMLTAAQLEQVTHLSWNSSCQQSLLVILPKVVGDRLVRSTVE